MADASGNGHDGQYKNDQDSGPVGIAGDGDHARRFFGAGGYGYVNGIAAPQFQSTIEAWVRPDDGRDHAIVGHGDAGELLIQGGHFVFRHMDRRVTTSVGVTPGQWSQVVGVWDGVNLKVYVDGILRGTQEATRRPSSVSTFYVGYGELAPWLEGSIDEVAYYGTALTDERVYEHFLADPPPGDAVPAVSPTTTTPTPSSTPPASVPAPPRAAVVPAPAGGSGTHATASPGPKATPQAVTRRFGLTGVKASTSTLTLSITAPGSGRVAAVATVRYRGKTIGYRSASAKVGTSTRSVTLTATGAIRSALRMSRSLKVKIGLKYTPARGTATTVTRTVTVKGSRRR